MYYVDTPNYSLVEDASCGLKVLQAYGKSLARSITDILDNPAKYCNGTGKKYIAVPSFVQKHCCQIGKFVY